MPNALIELVCSAEWVSHVAHSRREAEAYAFEANRWWAGNEGVPCPFDEYVPTGTFALEFDASQSVSGRWAVYVRCGWALSEHRTVDEALEAAERLYDIDGVSEPLMELLVFGREYAPIEDDSIRPLAFVGLELVVFKGTSAGLTSYVLGGVKGALTIAEEFMPASEFHLF